MINRIQPLPHDNTWRPLQQIAAICREYLQRWNNNLQVVKVWLAYLMKTFNGLDQTMSIGWVVQSPTIGIQRFKDYCTNRYSCIATHYWEFSSICIVWKTTTTLQQSVYMQFNGHKKYLYRDWQFWSRKKNYLLFTACFACLDLKTLGASKGGLTLFCSPLRIPWGHGSPEVVPRLTGPTDPGRLGSGQRLANLEDLCKKWSIPTWLPSLLAFRLALWTLALWARVRRSHQIGFVMWTKKYMHEKWLWTRSKWKCYPS